MDGQRAGALALGFRDGLAAEQGLALREAWRAFWLSRAVVWVAGITALLGFGRVPSAAEVHDPLGLTRPFGPLGDLLVAPAARWDAAWYLEIAAAGYDEPGRAAFFPLYPLLMRLAVLPELSLLLGIAISCGALLVGLVVLHRLVSIDLGPGPARLTVLLVAFFPAAIFFSAIYTESLYFALSVGAIYAARRGSWAWAGALGGACAATRSIGVLILVPLAILYLYGPRADRPSRGLGGRLADALRPRHHVTADAAWLLLVPAGLMAYVAYVGLATGEPLSPFTDQAHWGRHFVGPLIGIWDGAMAAWDGLRQVLSMSRSPVYFEEAGGDPFLVALRSFIQLGFLAFAVVGTIGVFRRLPAAYGAYVVVALIVPLSVPADDQPLVSLPRFLLVLFPLHMWLALWLSERRLARPALAVSGTLMCVWAALFTTWTAAG